MNRAEFESRLLTKYTTKGQRATAEAEALKNAEARLIDKQSKLNFSPGKLKEETKVEELKVEEKTESPVKPAQ